jgi:hypothetical protein
MTGGSNGARGTQIPTLLNRMFLDFIFCAFHGIFTMHGKLLQERGTELEYAGAGLLMGNPVPIVSHGQAFK